MNAADPSSNPSSFSHVVPGRRGESELLSSLLVDLGQGRGGTVLVSGEAGIGKTTLVDALARQAATTGVLVLAATSYELEVSRPYGLWLELFQNAQRNGALPATPAGFLDQERLESAGGARELWDLATRHLLDIAAHKPVLLVIEDLHWADQSSIELLRYLARQVSFAPVLIVVTYRDIDLTPAAPLYHLLPHLVREIRPTRLPLSPLGPEGARAVVNDRYPSLEASDVDRLAIYLEHYAEGNPLFIEELLGLLETSRVLQQEGGIWKLGELPEFAVPPLIRQIIERRIDHLSPEARTALEIASVIGVEVRLDIWQSLAAGWAGGGDDGFTVLEEVLRSSVLEETSQVNIVRFRHTLVRDAIYWNANPLQRRQWHARIGTFLAGLPDVDPGVVAHHFVQAEDPQAADWLIEAAQRASRAFAFRAAIEGYERALAILNHDPERLGDRVGVLCALAEAHRFTNTSQALAYIQQAVDLLERIDDPGAEVLARWVYARIRGFDDQNVLDDLIIAASAFERLSESERQRIADSPLGYVVSLATLSQELANYGRFSVAREKAEQFIKAHPRPASRAQYIEFGNAHFGLGIARAALGDPEHARTAFETARRYYRESGNFQMVSNCCYWELSSVLKVYYPDLPDERHRLQMEEVQSNLHSEFIETRTGDRQDSTSETLILDGDWNSCWRSANLRLGIPASRVPSARKLAEIEWLRGNPEKARDHIQTAMPAGPDEPPGRRFFLHRLELQRIAAELAADTGDLERALRWLEAFERWLDWSGMATGKADAELLRARFRDQHGDTDAALRHVQNAINLAADPPQPLARMQALRMLGALKLKTGDTDGARHDLDGAMTIAETCAMPYELALTQVIQAEALSSTGEHERAESLLGSARATAERLEAQPLLDRIDALRVLAQQPPQPDEPPLGLTRRQLEVLQLLARGMTDNEIADALFISPRTVHGHLNTIYSKLGVDSRTAAVARAYSEGVVSA